MSQIQENINVNVQIKTAVAPQASFSTALFLVDDAQIPADRRFRITTAADYDTDYTSGTDPYNFAQVFFGQGLAAQELYFGRWVSAAIASQFVCGSHETDYLLWKAVTDGTFTVTDGTNEDDLTGVDFSSITSLADVATVLTAELAAIAVPNITGLDSATFTFDSLSRLVLTHSVTGASAASLSIIAEGTGTDLTTSSFMDVDNGTAVAGMDAEEPADALAAISDFDDTYYHVSCERSLTVDQQVAVAAWVETKTKLCSLVTTEAGAKSAVSTTDLPYRLEALGYKRSMCIYTEQTTEWPDAASAGDTLPGVEGTRSWAWNELTGVTESGTNPLTATERSALEDKQCCYIKDFSGTTVLYDGITAGGEEMRVMWGLDWMTTRMEEDVFSFQVNSEVVVYENPDLTAIEGILRDYLEQGVDRKFLANTAERPLTINMPDADDITAAERATHVLTLTDAFVAYIASAINDYAITGTVQL